MKGAFLFYNNVEKEIKKLIEDYNANLINIGELYSELLKLQSFGNNLFEETIRNIAGAYTSFLLLTYQNSKLNQ